jgi:hypothetical protein
MTNMDEQVRYEELYRDMIEQMELMHKDNLHRIKIGFRSILIVPTIFLLLLFFTSSSKTVFLVLWIVSMFIIAVYLVIIEYSDYKLQARINRATDNEGAQATSLMQESIESNRNAMHELLMHEESKLPFKHSAESEDESEYDTGDDGSARELEDVESAMETDELDSGGLASDDFDTLCGESGSVLTPGSAAASAPEGAEPVIPIVDIDDDLDDISTILDDGSAVQKDGESRDEAPAAPAESEVQTEDDDELELDIPSSAAQPDTPEEPEADTDEAPAAEPDGETASDADKSDAGDESPEIGEDDLDGLSLEEILSEYHGDYFSGSGTELSEPDDSELDGHDGSDSELDEFEDSKL